jgi:orotate phosphoribosyltransferase
MRLKKLIEEKYMKRGDYTLSSGKKSNLYFDIKGLMLDPVGAPLVAEEFEKLITLGNDEVKRLIVLGGLELGAALLAPLMAYRGFQTFVVRKKKKGYGYDELVIGRLAWGSSVMLIDDVITTGNSIEQCKQILYHVCVPFATACIVDRTGGESSRKGKYLSLFNEKDFV